MRRGSVKRPVLIYAAVFMFALSFTLMTFASLAMVRAAQYGLREAAHAEASVLANADGLVPEMVLEARNRGRLVAIVSSRSQHFGINLATARRAAQNPEDEPSFASIPIRTGTRYEAYVVALVDPSGAFKNARHEIQKLLLVALGASIVLSLLLAMMIGRLVLSPLSALEQVAADRLVPDGLLSETDTPHEIAEVAQVFSRTVRQLKEEREEIRRQHGELARMQESLVRASKLASVGRLAAGVAHEIGNPLAAVLGYLSLMKKGLDEDELQDVLERCSKELNRIHDTIKKLLAYARQDTPEELSPFSTIDVINDTLVLMRGHPAVRDVTIETETVEGVTARADTLGHAQALGQVLVNLMVNAGQAMESQKQKTIRIRRKPTADQMIIEVADNGPGIPPEKQEQIFDPFYTTKAPGEGTGLGLAVSRSLIEQMDGSLSMHDEPGGGTYFRVRLKVPSTPGS